MASTGEVACLGENLHEAFFRSWQATEQSIKGKRLLVSVGGEQKNKILSELKILEAQGWKLYTTPGTHDYLQNGVASRCLFKASEEGSSPNVIDASCRQRDRLIINIPQA